MNIVYTPVKAITHYGVFEPYKRNNGYQAYIFGFNDCPYTDKASRVEWFAGWQEAADDHDAAQQLLYEGVFDEFDEIGYDDPRC